MSRNLIAGALAVGLVAGVAAGPAVAAPSAAVKKKNATQIKKIRVQDRSFAVQRSRVQACIKPGHVSSPALKSKARTVLAAQTKIRAASLKGLKLTAKPAVLNTKRVRLTAATKRLAAIAKQCAAAQAAPVTPGQGTPVALPATPAPVVVTPGTGGTGGAGGGGGSQAPNTITIGGLTLEHLRANPSGVNIDLSGVLGPDGVLPATLSLVNLDGLTGTLLGDGLLGIDLGTLLGANGLLVQINALTNQVVAAVPSALQCLLTLNISCVLNSVLTPLNTVLATVDTLVSGLLGNTLQLGDILKLERISDTVVRLVAVGPLASLLQSLPIGELTQVAQGGGSSALNLLNLLNTPLGVLQGVLK